MNSFLKKHKYIIAILFLGLLLRFVFILFGAEIYYGRENIFVDGDTFTWKRMFDNLISHGIFTFDPSHEYAAFARMPGYSFFMGLFYFIAGGDWDAAYPIIAWAQTILDVFTIFIFYKIAGKVYHSTRAGLLAALLYSIYPFIIVWNPVVYSESMAIFLMCLGIYFSVRKRSKYDYMISGVFIGLGVLFRPQILLLIIFLLLYIVLTNRGQGLKFWMIRAVFFLIGIAISYGPWPARNLINHNKVILTQDLRGLSNWDIDVVSFMQYIYTIKVDWEPQFTDILENKKVSFPDIAYVSEEDSLLLESTIEKCKVCGTGFSNWKKYWQSPNIPENQCNSEIAQAFDKLRTNQIKENPAHVFFIVPMQNLLKAVFKFKLYDQGDTTKSYLSKGLFLFRTILILLGFWGLWVRFAKGKPEWILGLFSISLYLFLCFGLGVQFRNIEIRYFLPADILLLIFVSGIPIKKLYNDRSY